MRENRKEPRRRTKEWAKLVLLDGSAVYNCTITDISTCGASLRVGDATIPDRFYFFRKREGTLYRVAVRSRRYGTVGVEFLEPVDPIATEGSRVLMAIERWRTVQALRVPWRRGFCISADNS
jgi:hypothetical protein